MFSEDIKKEILNMAGGILVLSVIMLIIFALAGFWSINALYGCMLGAGYAFFNFVLLAISVQKASVKNPKAAQGVMGLSYTLRYILTGVVVVWGIKSPVFNYLAVVIPLVFPRIVIMVTNIIRRRSEA